MIINYRLDKSFGPPGTTVGIFLILVGLSTVYMSYSGAILIFIGSFMAFSESGSSVDVDNFKIRFSNNLFGFIRIGKWIYINPKMKIGMSNAKITYRVYSMSNRSVDVSNTDFRIYLYDENGRKGNAICRFKKKEKAEDELARLSDLLGLEILEQIKRN